METDKINLVERKNAKYAHSISNGVFKTSMYTTQPQRQTGERVCKHRNAVGYFIDLGQNNGHDRWRDLAINV